MADNDKYPASYPETRAGRLQKLIGRDVVVEGIYPLPVQTEKGMQVIYSPAKGKLVAVYEDAVEILEGNDAEPTMFFMQNLRSLHPVSKIMQPPAKTITV